MSPEAAWRFRRNPRRVGCVTGRQHPSEEIGLRQQPQIQAIGHSSHIDVAVFR
jgi:hypothetical protein